MWDPSQFRQVEKQSVDPDRDGTSTLEHDASIKNPSGNSQDEQQTV